MDKIRDINFIFEIISKNCNNRFITGFLKEIASNMLNTSTKTIQRQLNNLKNNNYSLQINLRKKISKSFESHPLFTDIFKNKLYFDKRFIINIIESTKSSTDIWGIFIFYQYIIYYTIFEIREILQNSNIISVSELRYFKELNKIYIKEEIIEMFRSLIELGYLINKKNFQKKFLEFIFENIGEIKFEDKYINANIDFENLSEKQKNNIKKFKKYQPKSVYTADKIHLEYTAKFCLKKIKRKFLEN